VAARGRHRPIRTCVACGRRAARGELRRLVVVGGEVVFDPRRRLPGRGAWLCPGRECLERLARDKGRDRVFRRRLGEDAWREVFAALAGPDQGRE